VRRRSQAWRDATYWVLDVETGGLDPARNSILSVGMVPVREGVVKVGESFYSLIRSNADIDEESLAVHHILPGELAGAPAEEEVIAEIDARVAEGVVVVHFAPVDIPFLRRLYESCGRQWPKPDVVDTAALAARLDRLSSPLGAEAGDLGTLRARFGLPRYAAHHALSDALATAELFIVLRHHLGARTLRDLT